MMVYEFITSLVVHRPGSEPFNRSIDEGAYLITQIDVSFQFIYASQSLNQMIIQLNDAVNLC